MPRKTVISISANDDLVPGHLVAAHLENTKSPATLMTHPTAAHGGIFLDSRYQDQLLASIKRVI
jgi:hypothetical protein